MRYIGFYVQLPFTMLQGPNANPSLKRFKKVASFSQFDSGYQ